LSPGQEALYSRYACRYDCITATWKYTKIGYHWILPDSYAVIWNSTVGR
jgi:hypothetical protein